MARRLTVKWLLGIYLVILAFHPYNLFAQQYNFHNYSVKDGVAQSQVYSVLQDSRGYLWMGTRGGGITRFDGTEFKTYTVKDGLINNYVFCIREDARHNLWIGTNNGISHFNGILFKNYPLNADSSQVWVQEIDFDKTGRLWLATNQGVLLLDPSMREGKNVINITKKLRMKPEVVNALHIDKKGNVWFGTGRGLYRTTEKNNQFDLVHYTGMNNSITTLKEDKNGNVWVGTYGDGLYVYNWKKFHRIDLNLELYLQTVLDIYFDNRNNVWLATLTNGVCQYDLGAKSFTWLKESEGLSNNHVRCITQDNSGNYWFGTSGGGVCNYFGKQFTHYDKASGRLAGNYVYSIYRDSKGTLWVGTSDKGVSLFDSSKSYNSSNGFVDVKVRAICEDNNGIIYLGTDGQGVYKFDGTSFSIVSGLERKYVRGMIKDKDGNLWIATAGTGLYKLVPGADNKLLNFTTSDGLLHDRLTCLLYDKTGRLWYGTENNGIGLVQDDQAQKLFFSTRDGLPANSIRCLAEDRNGYLWAGTAGYGIASLPLYQGDYQIKNYDHTKGLTSSNIYLITSDNKNNLFVGTETGLDHITFDKERRISEVKHYGKGEGFTGIETCQNAVWNDADGTIWFGTINGLSKYNPANLVKNENAPITTIGEVRLQYKPISETEYRNLAGDWNTIHKLELPYSENHITFNFQGINFSNPEAVRYQWKLDGADKEWSPPSKDRTITYQNLSPGNYTFMVKACNEDGVWNVTPASFTFSIAAPIWLRWWFITAVVLVLGGALSLLFKWRENRIRATALAQQNKLQLEKEVVELEQKALRLQMNPHFIFNALNSIQSQIGTDNEQAARYYLAKFSRLMRQILDNSRNTSITLEEEVNTLENYLLIEKFCNGDRFDYRIHVDENIEKDYVKIPPMLMQPFVENAIKHGLKNMDEKRGVIEVSFTEKDNVLECSVIDNGIGRKKAEEMIRASKETYHKSTALAVTQERLDIFKEESDVRSLEIVDLVDEKGVARGTKVIVRIPIG
jgi:ligand-binding sensor domain-containing protein